jgi:pyridoxal phosphate enzyme (YggS family)
MTTIADNLHRVRARISEATLACARPLEAVTLLAVSKTFDASAVRAAHAAGQSAFGENYIQEAVDKMAALADLPLQWHCIGPVQSNKTRLVAAHFNWVQSIDRLKTAQRLNEQRPADQPPLQVCIQVNIDGGLNKAGVPAGAVLELARQLQALPRLRLRGLMSIPEPESDFAAACTVHAQARRLFDSLNAQGLEMDTLSMGMTGDLEAAVQSGSTMVRVGTAIFGLR